MDQGEARRTLEQCLRVLYYRDCRTINKVFVLLNSTIVSEYQIEYYKKDMLLLVLLLAIYIN